MGKNYVIGDVQGCYRSLLDLLSLIGPTHDDHIWFVGDLVNRGPNSLDVLDFIYKNQKNMSLVLGNHDLHLLRRYFFNSAPKEGDTLEPLLGSPNASILISWLACQPLVIEMDKEILVHAGIHPLWSLEHLRSIMGKYLGVFGTHQGRQGYLPKQLTPPEISCLVTMRTVDDKGILGSFKGSPADLPTGVYPWFEYPQRIPLGKRVIFGHWSALGAYYGKSVICLDSGCVWGGELTGFCMETEKFFSVASKD